MAGLLAKNLSKIGKETFEKGLGTAKNIGTTAFEKGKIPLKEKFAATPAGSPAQADISGISDGQKMSLQMEGDKQTEQFRSTIFEKTQGFIKFIFEKIYDIFYQIFKHLAKWIAVLIVILLIFGIIGFASKNNNKRRDAAYSDSSGSIFGTFHSTFISPLTNGAKSISRPLGKKATNGIPREIEENGRCNDIEWVSMEGNLNKKKVGLCFQSSIEKPASIRWIIDPTNLYEYDMLPSAIKKKIGDNPNILTITIPYKNKGSSYVLSCRDAVYADGSSAKDLFGEETDKYCKFNIKTLSNSYKYTTKYRQAGNGVIPLDSYQ